MRFLPRLDSMESRTLLSTWTVTNTDDSGPGSLRFEIGQAGAGDTVDFARRLDGQTITLTSAPLTLGVDVNIEGPGAADLTISGGGKWQAFVVPAGVSATIRGLTIADGSAAQGGGVDNFGTLAIDGCTLRDNTAVGGSGESTTPAAANGGAIANEVGASLSVADSDLVDNVAAASPGDDAFGGAILNLGAATVKGCTFSGNQATGGGSSSYFDGSTGGAIESFGFPPDQLYGASLDISHSTFVDNTAMGASGSVFAVGGAIDLEFGVVATIDGCSFAKNVATGGAGCDANGGAINTEGCTLTLTDSSFTGNQAIAGTFNGSFGGFGGSDAFGGAVLEDIAGTTVNATNCVLIGNQAIGGSDPGGAAESAGQAGGGGMEAGGGSTLSVTDCTIMGNRAIGGSGGANAADASNAVGFGGGIAVTFGGTLTVSDSMVTGNLAQGGSCASGGGGQAFGGGISNNGSSTTILNSVLGGNRAEGGAGAGVGGDAFGGGLDDSSTATTSATNSLFVGNRAQGGAGGAGSDGGDGIGGGISVAEGSLFGLPDTSSLTLVGSQVIANVAKGGAGGAATGGDGWGGGLFVGSTGGAVLTDAVIILNQAIGGSGASGGLGLGGGLYVASGGAVTLKKSHVLGNFASTNEDNIYGIVSYA